MINKALFSHDSKEWRTPKQLFHVLNEQFHFKLDACTTNDNPLGIPYFYTEFCSGLTHRWYNTTYCNPPYGRDVHKWIEKALLEQQRNITTVMLLPARTDTKWFHDHLYNNPNVDIRFLRGRLKFNDGKIPAPFPSMYVIFNGYS